MLLRLFGSPSHLLRWLLTLLSKLSTVEIGTADEEGPQDSGKNAMLNTQALNFPGRPDLSMALSQPPNSEQVYWMDLVSISELSKTFP